MVEADRESLIDSETRLVALAVALGAHSVPGWSPAERELAGKVTPARFPQRLLSRVRDQIRGGSDPLGDAFCSLRPPAVRRSRGATYTPPSLVDPMLDWAADCQKAPGRVVDPGAGSGRFTVAAGRRFAGAQLIGVENDPVAALMCRATIAAAGFADRSMVLASDFCTLRLPAAPGQTLFLGNPPYVRHHQIPAHAKDWLALAARSHGLEASRLAGLHVYFFLATAQAARAGDVGVFVTSAEWLDTNYGRLVRELLLGPLGGRSLHVLDPSALPFDDAAVTAAITCFRPWRRSSHLRVRRVARMSDLGSLTGGVSIAVDRLRDARRWSPFTRDARRVPDGYIQLGDICRVHRGAVTGKNSTWVIRPGDADLPEGVLFPAVTRAREIIEAGPVLASADHLKLVVNLPADLESFGRADRGRIDRFLRRARREGADAGYIARNRRNWWAVGLAAPAPILATYMARRSPAFTRNLIEARHLNIAHGLYPTRPLADDVLERLISALRDTVTVEDGRTYAGGLTKFEPKEMERLLIMNPLG